MGALSLSEAEATAKIAAFASRLLLIKADTRAGHRYGIAAAAIDALDANLLALLRFRFVRPDNRRRESDDDGQAKNQRHGEDGGPGGGGGDGTGERMGRTAELSAGRWSRVHNALVLRRDIAVAPGLDRVAWTRLIRLPLRHLADNVSPILLNEAARASTRASNGVALHLATGRHETHRWLQAANIRAQVASVLLVTRAPAKGQFEAKPFAAVADGPLAATCIATFDALSSPLPPPPLPPTPASLPASTETLSPILRETLAVLLTGRTEPEAAKLLNVNTETLHSRVTRIYGIYGVHGRHALIARLGPRRRT